MADAFLGITEPDSGAINKRIDCESLTVDATTVFRQRIQIAGATAADLAVVSAANGLQVDVTKLIPTTTATALGKAIDTAVGATDTGVGMLVQRVDAPSTLTPASGDWVAPRADSLGRLWTQTILAAGTAGIGKLTANSGVDIGDVDVTSIIPGTGATNLGKAEDGDHTSGDTGVMALAVRTDSPTNRSGGDGKYEPPQISGGLLWTRVRGLQTPAGDSAMDDTANALKVLIVDAAGSAITAGAEYTHGETDATPTGIISMWHGAGNAVKATSAADPLPVQLQASTGTQEIVGDAAHDAAIAGNPVRIGATAETSIVGRTVVSDGDATDLMAGVDGVLIVRPHANLEDITRARATNTDGVSTAFSGELAAPGAGIRHYITWIHIANSSSSFCTVDIDDGAGGTPLDTLPVPPTSGVVFPYPTPLKFTANTAVAFNPSAAIATLTITAGGFKSKV